MELITRSKGKSLGNRYRFTDPSAFNEQVVKLVHFGQLFHLDQSGLHGGIQQIHPLAHLYQLLICPGEFGSIGNQFLVNIDFTHVIYDHSYSKTLTVVEHMVEQSSFLFPPLPGNH